MAGTEPFGSLLRRLRLDARLSQEALADRAQLSSRAVSDLERGVNRTARRYTAELLAAALELDATPRARFLSAAAGRPAPAEATNGVDRLLGRDEDLREAADLLTTGSRLVTVTGPGGVGKTRLAAELRRRLAQHWADGSTWVELGGLTDPDLVAPVVATAVAVPSGGPALLALTNHLRTHNLLLVLDNAEHVLQAVAELAAAILTSATGVSVLVTSRAPLRLGHERVFALGPLSVVSTNGVASAAAELFATRAQSANPAWPGHAADGPAIGEICRRLDGLPLAIELAAARTRLLAPADLLQRLDLDLLVVRGADLPKRQRTMRALIGWSYGLLSPSEQGVFAALSVFRGSWDIPAAERVVGRRCLDEVEALLEANLLLTHPSAGTVRLRMLDTIAHFAAERLGAGPDAAECRTRHLDWCVGLAGQAADKLTGPEQGEWLERLELDHDNLRAALAQTMGEAGGEAELLVAGLWRFWYLRGHLTEGRRWIDQVLARPAATELAVAAARGRAQYGAAVLAWMQGDNVAATQYAQKAYDALRELGEQTAAAHVITLLGMIAQYRGEHELAAEHFAAALVIGRGTGDRRTVAVSLINIGGLATEQGEEAVAEYALRESLEAFGELGDGRSEADVLGNLSELAARQGRLAEAAELVGQALARFVELGDRTGENEARQSLGRLKRLLDDAAGASAEWEAVLTLSAELGDPWGRAAARSGLAGLAEMAGDPAAADRFQHALDLHRDLDHRQGVVGALEGLLRIAEAGGDEAAARRWHEELQRLSVDSRHE